MDILRLEHGATLLVPLLLAQAVLDAPLAIPQPFPYRGFHLKYLPSREWASTVPLPFPQKGRGISSFSPLVAVRAPGKRLFWD